MVIKLLLLAGALLVMRTYVMAPRSTLRDRLIMIPLWGVVILSVIEPDITSWAARKMGVSRGADLAFYVAFLLVFFVVGILRVQVREQQHQITCLVQEMARLQADVAEATEAEPRTRPQSTSIGQDDETDNPGELKGKTSLPPVTGLPHLDSGLTA